MDDRLGYWEKVWRNNVRLGERIRRRGTKHIVWTVIGILPDGQYRLKRRNRKGWIKIKVLKRPEDYEIVEYDEYARARAQDGITRQEHLVRAWQELWEGYDGPS